MVALIHNLGVLIALSVVSTFIIRRWGKDTLSGKIFQGALFGSVAVIGMLNPLVMESGLIFDGRSVVISLCALFFGPVASVISSSMALACRVYQGGLGMWTGITVITSSAAIGLLYYAVRKNRPESLPTWHILGFGILVHLAMIAAMFTLPLETAFKVVKTIGLPIMLVYPLATLLIGKILSDQEERQKHMAQVLASEEQFRALFAAVSDPVLVADRDTGILVECNLAAERYFGRSRGQLIGLPQRELHPPETTQVEGVTEDFKRVTTDPRQTEEVRLLAAGGEVRYVEITSSTFEIGKSRLILGVFRDVSEKRLAQEALRESEARLRTLINAMPDVVCFKDGQGRWLEANAFDLELFQLSGVEYHGKKDSELAAFSTFYREALLTCEASDEVAWDAHYPSRAEETIPRPDGNSLTFDVIKVPTYYPDGRRKGLVVVGRDITERKQAEETLRKSEALMRTLKESLPDLVWLKDMDGVYITCNQAFERFFGAKAVEIIGRRDHDFVDADLADFFLEQDRKALATGLSVRNEERLGFADTGYEGIFETIKTPMSDDLGNVIGVLGISRDITERKRLEQSMDLLASRLIEAQRIAQVGDWDWSVEEDNATWSDQMFTLLGLDPTKQVPTYEENLALYHDEDAQRLKAAVSQALSDGTPYILELRRTKPDGSEIYVQARGLAQRDATGKVVRLYGSAQDITDRKRAEGKLNESQEKRLNLIHNIHAGVVVHAPDTSIHFANAQASNLLGLTNDQLMGKAAIDPAWCFMHEDGTPLLVDEYPVAKVLAAKSPVRDLTIGIIRPPENDCVWVMVNAFPEFDTHGQLSQVVVTFADITEWKRAEVALSRAKDVAEAANRAKSEFLANLSHEIRTPLNGVLGMLQLLQHDVESEERVEYTGLAYDAGCRLLSLLNDILDFSKMEAGQLHLASARFSMGAVVDDVAKVFAMACQAKGLELTATVDPSVPAYLVGDEARLRQILFNLIGNAIKFTPSGSVQVDVWAHPSKRFADKARVYLSVSDTGLGIPDDMQAHIFDRFTQVDASYTRRFEGAGLGLAIVKRIVDLMHGDITVESEEGKGTTLYLNIVLDNATQTDAGGGEKVEHPWPALRPLRILLADDEPIGQLSLQVMLGRMGHEIHTATNGREALEALQQGNFDCILMDIQMPEMDGVEATRIIRSVSEIGDKQNIPIIALTAYAMQGDREKFLEAGMNDHVAKPVQMEELKKALERVVEKMGKRAKQ